MRVVVVVAAVVVVLYPNYYVTPMYIRYGCYVVSRWKSKGKEESFHGANIRPFYSETASASDSSSEKPNVRVIVEIGVLTKSDK